MSSQSLKERILALAATVAGLTDREITDRLIGDMSGQQQVNQAARALEASGRLIRRHREDGKIGNYLASVDQQTTLPQTVPNTIRQPPDARVGLSEDDVKTKLKTWLEQSGWQTNIRWGHERGVDIEASRDNILWYIEVKGSGSLNPMRVNYFLAILGELLQRMSNPNALYSIALPDHQQYRNLWQRLPELAKKRTTITALFVHETGRVEEMH